MAVRYLHVDEAPHPPTSARYSHAVEVGGVLYVTGQLPVPSFDPNGQLPADIELQAKNVFANLRTIVEAVGYSLDNTVFARIYLSNFERDYARFNAVYDSFFQNDDKLPARTTIGVSQLGGGALIEIDLTLAR